MQNLLRTDSTSQDQFACSLQLLLLLILQSFDWLAAFHLELLQAVLFIVV
jgi:hypothetical protein